MKNAFQVGDLVDVRRNKRQHRGFGIVIDTDEAGYCAIFWNNGEVSIVNRLNLIEPTVQSFGGT
jgi:hypothetical protein